MDSSFSAEQESLRRELAAYMAGLMTPALRAEIARPFGTEGGGPVWRAALRQMGKDGWIGLGWPTGWGGRGFGPVEQYIFIEEVTRSGFPFPYLTPESVGPAIAEFATPEIRERILPGILGGELVMAIGYSEPQAGTDLAALGTRAERDGDDYVINGQKVYTSLAHFADYVFLAVRTGDPATHPRHKGISILLVPTDSPGFSRTPIYTAAEGETNTTFYDNVRVPSSHLVGAENQGWQVITSQLNRERLTLMNPGTANLMYAQVLAYATEQQDASGQRLIDTPWVQSALARVHASLRALQLACRQQAWGIAQQTISPAEASAVKVYGYECFLQCYRLMQEVLGPDGLVKRGYPGNVLDGQLEHIYRAVPVYGFGGGTNEIQRDLIAQFGLGLARARR
jgi:alkylation response protein AidB-like acyl-CoA dehydrogenase